LLALSCAAAALILATCNSENPFVLVAQSRMGFALQKGQAMLRGLTGSIFGQHGGQGQHRIRPIRVRHHAPRVGDQVN
jgi:hypothetical protein